MVLQLLDLLASRLSALLGVAAGAKETLHTPV
jgi:hypothetical protein